MKDKLAILFNSPYLGGAERSLIFQLRQQNSQCCYFIPLLEGDKSEALQLKALLGSEEIVYYRYPKHLFNFSRSGGLHWFLLMPFFILRLFYLWHCLHLRNFKVIWANGNKVGFVAYLYALVSGYSGRFIWHFRDYPAQERIYRLIWRLFALPKFFKLQLVANSDSVAKELRRYIKRSDMVCRIYNPVGEEIVAKQEFCGKIIGVVSMFAPWKGVHQVLWWAALYRKELEHLGIERIKIFGGQIYRTRGEHTAYQHQLRSLSEKLANPLIEFCGIVSPREIFANIDLLIHSSLEREPFGRTIVEAFRAGIPVISTGLGGAAELMDKSAIVPLWDYAGQFELVKRLIQDDQFRQKLLGKNQKKLEEIENSIPHGLQELLSS